MGSSSNHPYIFGCHARIYLTLQYADIVFTVHDCSNGAHCIRNDIGVVPVIIMGLNTISHETAEYSGGKRIRVVIHNDGHILRA